MVQSSFKYLLKCSQIIKELFATVACNIVKLKLKTALSLAIFHVKLRQEQCTNHRSLNNSSTSLDTEF